MAIQEDSPLPPESEEPQKPGGFFGRKAANLSHKSRFALVVSFALLWMLFAIFLAIPWVSDLADIITLPLALLVIAGIAIVPGYLAAFLLASVLLDQPEQLLPPNEGRTSWPGVSVLIPAYNEEREIADTILHVLFSTYKGEIEVIVIDDASKDQTKRIASSIKGVRVISDGKRGKPGSLNRGLREARYDLILSLDADTLITPQAIQRLVSRLEKDKSTAVAGAVMVLNTHDTWLTRVQQWDYEMGIASIKRSQSLWNTTSVAQGAFSLYQKADLLESGGWRDMVGEDIVLTWSFLEKGRPVDFEPTAVAFTRAPHNLRGFFRQRSRWARGMLEGIRAHGREIIKNRRLASHGVIVNSLFLLVDTSYTFAFLPGVFLALVFSNFAIVGPMTLLVIPLNLLVFLIMYAIQKKTFQEIGVKLHRNRLGFFIYLFFYQALLAPISLFGYFEELIGRGKVWRSSKEQKK